MVKAEFSLLEVQRKVLCWDAFELGQAQFGVGSEELDSVDMAVTSSELVFSVMDSEMLGVADIDQALIASPAITMNDTFDRDMTADKLLQRGFSRIRDNLRIDPAIAFEDTEGNGFRSSTTTTFAPNSTGSEVGFIDFNLTREGAVEGAFIGPGEHGSSGRLR